MRHYRRSHMIFVIAVLGWVLVLSSNTLANDVKRYTLDECVQKALEFSPEIKEVQQDVEIARTRLDEAKSYQWPQIEALGLAGPTTDAKGNQIQSDYHNDRMEGLGPFGSIDLQLVQPLYTFGKITAAKKAASHGIKVDQSRVQQKATDVVLRIKEYYYGLVFANDAMTLIEEVDRYLKKALDRTQKLLAVESEHVTEMDLNKLEAYQGVIDKYRQEAVKSRTLAKEALRTFMGLPSESELRIADETLVQADVKVEELRYYIQQGQKLRPEFIQLTEGLAAKEALVSVAKADYYPTLFLGAIFSYAYAPERDRVTNPWIYDRFNHLLGGAGVGVKWSFNFGITTAQVNRSTAEVLKLRQTEDYANAGVPVQVEKSYRELLEAGNNIDSLSHSQKAARKWLIQASAGYDVGTVDSQELSNALVAFGSIRMDYLRSIYNFNLGYANLVQASGLSTLEVADKY